MKHILFKNSETCQPCKMLQPVIDEVIAKGYEIKIYDTVKDDDKNLALSYSVSSVPTLLKLDDENKVVDQMVGYRPEKLIIDFLESENK